MTGPLGGIRRGECGIWDPEVPLDVSRMPSSGIVDDGPSPEALWWS